jgi:hypothetical protein
MALIRRTVGTAGHYAKWSDAWNALVVVGVLTDDYEFRQISDITEDSWPNTSLPANRFTPNGHSVKFYCPLQNAHKGNPNAGYKTYLSGANGKLSMLINTTNSGNYLTVENLNIIQLTNNDVYLLSVYSASLAANIMLTVIIKNILVKGFTGTNSVGIVCPGSQDYYIVSNCKIWHIKYGFFTAPTVIGALLPNDGYVNRNRYENIFIYNTSPGAASTIQTRSPVVLPLRQRGQDFYCVYSFGSASNHSWPANISSTGNLNGVFYSADDDGRLNDSIAAGFGNYSNILSNLPYLPEFTSVNDSDDDFLNLPEIDASVDFVGNPRSGPAILKTKFNSQVTFDGGQRNLYDHGTTPSVSDDIAGNSYGQFGYYPIGCHNAQLNIVNY